MHRLVLVAILALFPLITRSALVAQDGTVVFSDSTFPAANSIAPSTAQLARLFPRAKIVPADELRGALAASSSHLLVLAYGSAFPEDAWPAIKRFLDGGGNLLVLEIGRASCRERG